ncbi:death-associated protein kinase 3-like [Macrosteles quadrilineatus]|uniref:death-associated protein kinase 3-like n=1 Tax=Macrosteles quadrilineatus TaxID=74068 RepID=UPI0023E1FE76|nr:death-associated protein kinase 3-like [Macrosteles quadrilineatus]
MREVVSLTPVVMSSQPGYLELSAEQAKRLIRTEPIEDYYEVEDQPFARGKYATVRRCRDRRSGRQYAAKFLRKRRRSADLRPEILHEVAVLEACKNSPRIVRLHEVFESTNEMVLLLELARGGELQMLLDKDEVPSEREVVRLMRQILDGLVYLHDINVAHLDIKPQNLVLTGEFPDCEVKLCDFGISRYLSQGADVREILGTPDYVAPEVLNYEPISLATDMWSVGVLVYVLLTGCSPFGGDDKQETFLNIAQCRLDFPDDLFEDISEDAKDFMQKLMVKNPSNRLTAKKCLQHPWFTRQACESSIILSVENKPTKPRTPVPSKRPIPACEEAADNNETTDFIPDNVANTKPCQETTAVRESCTSLPAAKPSVEDNINKGLSAERRKSFKASMNNLVQKLDSDGEGKDTKKTNSTVRENPSEVRLTKGDSFRSMTRANGMQTMPVSRFLRFTRSSNERSLFSHNYEVDRESVYKFRRVFIINDMEEHSPPPSINGSLSSDNSSISDSNSDTISEMSIDSSSDRSSIISLDDSFDFQFSKGLSHSRHYSSCYNVWEASKNQRSQARLYPRECSGSFARALSRFATQTEDVKEGAFIKQRKSLTVFNGGNPTTSTPLNGKKCVGLELMRERNGNLVVIREVKAINGSKFPRCSEVKCESVQSRIRKLQVQNGLKHELSKEHYNVF